jgi:hypothetical protein
MENSGEYVNFDELEAEFHVDKKEKNREEKKAYVEEAFDGIRNRSEAKEEDSNIFRDARTIVIGDIEDSLGDLPDGVHNSEEISKLRDLVVALEDISPDPANELDPKTRATLAAYFRNLRNDWENPREGVSLTDAKSYREICSRILTESYKGLPIPEAIIGEAPNPDGANQGFIHIDKITKHLQKGKDEPFTLDDIANCYAAIKENFSDDSNHELHKQRRVVELSRQHAMDNIHKKGYMKPVVRLDINKYNAIRPGLTDEELDAELSDILEFELYDEKNSYPSETDDGRKQFILDMSANYVQVVQQFDFLKETSVKAANAVEKLKKGENIDREDEVFIGNILARLEKNTDPGSMTEEAYATASRNFGASVRDQLALAA